MRNSHPRIFYFTFLKVKIHFYSPLTRKQRRRFYFILSESSPALELTIFQVLRLTFVFFPEVESRTQGSRARPRLRPQKKSEAKDSPSEDRLSRGQGQERSGPRLRTKDTNASVLQKKRSSKIFFRDLQKKKQKKVFKFFFQEISKKKRSRKKFFSRSTKFYPFKK